MPLALDRTRLLAKFFFLSVIKNLAPCSILSFFAVRVRGALQHLHSEVQVQTYRKLIPFRALLPVDYVGNLCLRGNNWLAWNRKSVSSFAW